jgi:hypothetical protein
MCIYRCMFPKSMSDYNQIKFRECLPISLRSEYFGRPFCHLYMWRSKYRAIISYLGEETVHFRNGYRYKHEPIWKQQGNSLNFRWQCSFVTSATNGAPITIKENGVSNAKGTLLLVIQGPFLGPIDRRTILLATSNYGAYGDMRKNRYINLRCHIPFESFESEFHRL